MGFFLCKRVPACCSLCHPDSSDKKCANFEVFNFARDLFAAFCGVLVRMYLNYTLQYFSEFISNVSLSDEKKTINKIFKYAYNFLSKFFDVNHWFFYEFFDLFDKVNGSDCYVIYDNKTKESILLFNFQNMMRNFIRIVEIFIFIWD